MKILFFATLCIGELPAIVILYLINMDKPVYIGSLQNYIPADFTMTRYIFFVVFLGVEVVESTAIVLNTLPLITVFIALFESSSFWFEELR